MISYKNMRLISEDFCGDTERKLFSYKTGEELVGFFNNNFNFNDSYGSGFLSRWNYCLENIQELSEDGKIENFFNLVLSIDYIIKDSNISETEAYGKRETILNIWNKILRNDFLTLKLNREKIVLVNIDSDLKQFASGGFANIYREISSGYVVKKLKPGLLHEKSNVSRFKREYEIIKELQDIEGIVRVFDFNSNDSSYRMKYYETTLEKYVIENELAEMEKKKIIENILSVITKVHKRECIHRDISSNNIFIENGEIYIADFGLGKNLETEHSYLTRSTKGIGQLLYCDPRQYMLLREGDKQSDVFSLGCVINFIMTKDPRNRNHKYKVISEKCMSVNIESNYIDAEDLHENFIKINDYIDDDELKDESVKKILNHEYDEGVEYYISTLDSNNLCSDLIKYKNSFLESLIKYVKSDENRVHEVLDYINYSMIDECKEFNEYDIFAKFAKEIVVGEFEYTSKEKAAGIMNYIADDMNRFNIRNLIKSIVNIGVEPLIEGILVKNI